MLNKVTHGIYTFKLPYCVTRGENWKDADATLVYLYKMNLVISKDKLVFFCTALFLCTFVVFALFMTAEDALRRLQ
jgi:hypothetical protein